MPSLDAWLADTGDLAALPTEMEATRAALAWRRINDKPTSVTFRTPAGVTLSAQTVRIESANTASEAMSDAGLAPERYVIIFGIRNHATLTNTDMQEGYTFNYLNDQYRIIDTILTLGEIQGTAEARG